MATKQSIKWITCALGALLIILAGIGAYKVLHPTPASYIPPESQMLSSLTDLPLSPVPIGGPFELIDQAGAPRTEKSFSSKYLIVYFGYSYCPDVCPMALHTLSQAMEEIDPQGQRFQPLFITVDPQRDTPENLALYAQNFHPTFILLTGSPEKIKAACKAYRVYAAASLEEGSTEGLIDHSSVIYVMNPQGQFVAHFNHQTPQDEMVRGLKGVLKN